MAGPKALGEGDRYSTGRSGWFRKITASENQTLLALVPLQIASSYLSVSVPETQIFMDFRWLFGIIGFVVLPRFWQAFLLTITGSLAGFHEVSLLTAFLANMLFAVPLTVVTRLVTRRVLYKIPNNLLYGASIAVLVVLAYQLIVTPLIWLVLGLLDGTNVITSVISGWDRQELLSESVAVAVLSALVLMYWRLYRELRKTVDEKELLLRELFHRTRNNMSVIQSMLSLRAARDTNPEVQQLVRDTAHRIHSIALVHDKLHENQDLERIALDEYLEDLVRHVFQESVPDPTRIQLQLRLDPIHLQFETTVPVGMLVSELVTNAVRHAFPDGRSGILSIEVYMTNSEVVVIVSDNGIGMPEGFDRGEEQTLGLTTAAMLAEHQLGGTFELQTTGGVSVTVRFPVEQR